MEVLLVRCYIAMTSSAASKEIFCSYGREPEVTYFVQKLKQDLESRG